MAAETPIYPLTAQDRWKKRRIEFEKSPVASGDFDRAAEELVKDDALPLYVRTILAFLMESRKQFEDAMARNRELLEEVKVLSHEVTSLRKENVKLKDLATRDPQSSPNNSLSVVSSNQFYEMYEERERRRSIVIIGVPENRNPNRASKISHDFRCVGQILDHLAVECDPISVYRMGRPNTTYDRLLKVVLPSSFHASLALKRASQMRFFPLSKGVFIRPSLSKEERLKRRAQRRSRLSVQKSNVVEDSGTPLAVPNTNPLIVQSQNSNISMHSSSLTNTPSTTLPKM